MMARGALVVLGLAVAPVTYGSSLAQTPAATPKPSPRSAAATLAPPAATKTPPPPPASYTRKGRRDPFEPIETSQSVGLAVTSARLRGIIRGSSIRALLETPDGVGYIMKQGDTLGDGRLIEIGADSVVFRIPPRRGATTDRVVLRLSSD